MFVRIDAQLRTEQPVSLGFAELGQRLRGQPFLERDLEDLLRRSPDLLSPEDANETLLIIGQQVQNQAGGRADLVAVDATGALVLIEIKRDAADMIRRTDPFEWQALRYAASYALLKSEEDVVARLFAPYIARHRDEFAEELGVRTTEEIARRKLRQFLADNNIRTGFNQRQRIVLVASSFDQQVLSACAWLTENRVDIRCVSVQPMQLGDAYFLELSQVLPQAAASDFYVDVADVTAPSTAAKAGEQVRSAGAARAKLPVLSDMFSWGLVHKGDALEVKRRPGHTAVLQSANTVEVQGEMLSPFAWAKRVTGWSSVNIYEWLIVQRLGQTLDQVRRDELARQAAESGREPSDMTEEGHVAGAPLDGIATSSAAVVSADAPLSALLPTPEGPNESD